MADTVLRPRPGGQDDPNDPYFTVTSIAVEGDTFVVTEETGRCYRFPVARPPFDNDGVVELRLAGVRETRYGGETSKIPMGFLISEARKLTEIGGYSWREYRLFTVDRDNHVVIALPTLGFEEPDLERFGTATGMKFTLTDYPTDVLFARSVYFPTDFVMLRGTPRRLNRKLGRQVLVAIAGALVLGVLIGLILLLAAQ